MASFTVDVMGLGGEFGYMTTIEPAEKLNNWSQLASTGNMVRYVIENLVSLTGMAVRCTKRRQQAMPFAKKLLSA